MNITRRDALLGATAVAATVALAGVPARGTRPDPDAQVKALCQKWEAMYSDVNSDNVTDDERYPLVSVMDRLADRIADMPACSLDGVLHKLKVASRYTDDEADRYVDSTIRDLERLAGRARS